MNHDQWPDQLIVVDVEGNGANPPDLVEVACLPIRAGQPDHDTARSWLIRPPVPVTPIVARIHKLTNDALADCPAWEAVRDDVRSVIDGAWVCAHHASVEYKVLTRHLPDWQPAGVIDTLRLARATYTDAPKHNLDALIEHADLDLSRAPAHRHRAAYDTYATAQLLTHMTARYDTWNALTNVAVPAGLPGQPPDEQEPTLW